MAVTAAASITSSPSPGNDCAVRRRSSCVIARSTHAPSQLASVGEGPGRMSAAASESWGAIVSVMARYENGQCIAHPACRFDSNHTREAHVHDRFGSEAVNRF